MIDIQRGPAPASLSRQTSYKSTDVLTALYRDFLGKCYLFEGILPRGSISVEHRVDQAIDPAQVYDWTNLFPAHQSCNNRRPETTQALLSPGANQSLEQRLTQKYQFGQKEEFRFFFVASNPSDPEAEATAKELYAIHCEGTRTTSKWAAENLREDILHEILDTMELERRFLNPALQQNPTMFQDVKTRLTLTLSRKAPYTMLKRSIIHHPDVIALFD
jgi:hypothetical protein